ncbi:TPA: hypothetical protein DCX15_06705 [bacterium]|nr:hypothetical protein [bacterium]
MGRGLMIETIIFDLGKVILDFDHHLITQKLSQISGYDEAKLFDLIFASDLVKSFDEGRLSPNDFFREIIGILNTEIDFERFTLIWNDIFFPPKEGMVKLLSQLKEERYHLYLLSNTNILHFEYIWERHEILRVFEGYILSYQLGVTKPDPQIYLEALKRSNSPPERCIYIDDIEEFAEAATSAGIKGIHFQSIEKLYGMLIEMGILDSEEKAWSEC